MQNLINFDQPINISYSFRIIYIMIDKEFVKTKMLNEMEILLFYILKTVQAGCVWLIIMNGSMESAHRTGFRKLIILFTISYFFNLVNYRLA
jgi:hypothetical protein